MLMALVVLWALYARLKDPATWRMFLNENPTTVAEDVHSSAVADNETVLPGPNDQDPDEAAAVQDLFELLTDRAPLKSREMEAYWRLIDWSRTEPFSKLEQRARTDVPFTQLWEQPEKYRGTLIRLRLHVRRVLEYDAPENPSGIAKICEAWGWTDESRSFPYVVVFPEPPKHLPVGTDIRTEVVFVGYFLKVMTYTAFDTARGAPLLVGRVQLVSTPQTISTAKSNPWVIYSMLTAGILVAAIGFWMTTRTRKRRVQVKLPSELSNLDDVALSDIASSVDRRNSDQLSPSNELRIQLNDHPPNSST